jgi:energy-converting hydrogenase B subunit D
MIVSFQILLPLIVVGCAFAALTTKDLLSATVILSAYSFLICLLWAELGAVDVAFTEAAVGAGISTVLLLGAILHTTRRSSD